MKYQGREMRFTTEPKLLGHALPPRERKTKDDPPPPKPKRRRTRKDKP